MGTWKTYEEVATYLLNQFASQFGLSRVEGKQKVTGHRSGTEWEIDGKGCLLNGEGFLIVECRRYTNSRQSQEKIGALAYRILDTGAEGGIVVSPLGLQEGATKVAAAENVTSVLLNEETNTHEYFMAFLNKVMIGARAVGVGELNKTAAKPIQGEVTSTGELSKVVAKDLKGEVGVAGSLSMKVIRGGGRKVESDEPGSQVEGDSPSE